MPTFSGNEPPSCNWPRCRMPETGKCFAWCRCRCHSWRYQGQTQPPAQYECPALSDEQREALWAACWQGVALPGLEQTVERIASDAARAAVAERLCSQCGELMACMIKVGTEDGWCEVCLDQAAERALVERLGKLADDIESEALANSCCRINAGGYANAIRTAFRPEAATTEGAVASCVRCDGDTFSCTACGQVVDR